MAKLESRFEIEFGVDVRDGSSNFVGLEIMTPAIQARTVSFQWKTPNDLLFANYEFQTGLTERDFTQNSLKRAR